MSSQPASSSQRTKTKTKTTTNPAPKKKKLISTTSTTPTASPAKTKKSTTVTKTGKLKTIKVDEVVSTPEKVSKITTVPIQAHKSTSKVIETKSGSLLSLQSSVETHTKSPVQPYNTTRAEASQAPTAASPNQVDVESISKKGDVRSLTRTYTTTTYGTKKKCAGCKKMFGTDDYIIAGDKNWHEACFLCTSCGKKANPHRFFLDKNKMPLCEPCSKAAKK